MYIYVPCFLCRGANDTVILKKTWFLSQLYSLLGKKIHKQKILI